MSESKEEVIKIASLVKYREKLPSVSSLLGLLRYVVKTKKKHYS